MSSSSAPGTPRSPSSKKDWTETAKQELGSTNTIEKLVHYVDDIPVLPYYDASDLPTQLNYQLPVSENEFVEPRNWLNVPRIRVNDAVTANQQALQALNRGADGILFELGSPNDFKILLQQIELPYCRISFLADTGQEKHFVEFCARAKEEGITEKITGSIFWKSPPSGSAVLANAFHGWSQFSWLGIMEPDSLGPSSEIASLLAKAVKQIDRYTDAGIPVHTAIRSIAFYVTIGTDFFLEIAKLKSLRFLWNQITAAYDSSLSSSCFIHARIPDWNVAAFEPHGAMLNGTTAGLSSVLGGCDALTIETDVPDNPLATRIALNVSSILKEESHIGKNADPLAGSYYLENLTDQFAKQSWKKFQELVKS